MKSVGVIPKEGFSFFQGGGGDGNTLMFPALILRIF